jgi:hypothetical protein
MKFIAVVLAVVCLTLGADAEAETPGAPNSSATPAPAHGPYEISELVRDYRNSLVFVTGSNGAGSGFLATLGKANFLVTNAHVAAGVKGAGFKTLDGQDVKPGAPAVAVGHDIFVMQAPPGGKPFQVMSGVDSNASIGDAVVVLGNAEGAGVINSIPGKIVGLGANLVEVDAPFVPGNSGSPIIHLKTGKVIGVATYLTIKNFDPATKQVIRDPIVRRFGYRLDSVKSWQPVNWNAFAAQAAEMKNIEALTTDFVRLINDLAKHHKPTPGMHTNPAIKSRIDWWESQKRGRMSPQDAAVVDENFWGFLKTAAQADVTVARQQITYDYFQRDLAEQQKARNEISDVFASIIKQMGMDR